MKRLLIAAAILFSTPAARAEFIYEGGYATLYVNSADGGIRSNADIDRMDINPNPYYQFANDPPSVPGSDLRVIGQMFLNNGYLDTALATEAFIGYQPNVFDEIGLTWVPANQQDSWGVTGMFPAGVPVVEIFAWPFVSHYTAFAYAGNTDDIRISGFDVVNTPVPSTLILALIFLALVIVTRR